MIQNFGARTLFPKFVIRFLTAEIKIFRFEWNANKFSDLGHTYSEHITRPRYIWIQLKQEDREHDSQMIIHKEN